MLPTGKQDVSCEPIRVVRKQLKYTFRPHSKSIQVTKTRFFFRVCVDARAHTYLAVVTSSTDIVPGI